MASDPSNKLPIGSRVAAQAVARQYSLDRKQYASLCQQLARETVQSQTHVLDHILGTSKHPASAKAAERLFRNAGIGEAYKNPSQINPGDLVYSQEGSKQFGHAMVAGPDKQLYDQVGHGPPAQAGFRHPSWIVHPDQAVAGYRASIQAGNPHQVAVQHAISQTPSSAYPRYSLPTNPMDQPGRDAPGLFPNSGPYSGGPSDGATAVNYSPPSGSNSSPAQFSTFSATKDSLSPSNWELGPDMAGYERGGDFQLAPKSFGNSSGFPVPSPTDWSTGNWGATGPMSYEGEGPSISPSPIPGNDYYRQPAFDPGEGQAWQFQGGGQSPSQYVTGDFPQSDNWWTLDNFQVAPSDNGYFQQGGPANEYLTGNSDGSNQYDSSDWWQPSSQGFQMAPGDPDYIPEGAPANQYLTGDFPDYSAADNPNGGNWWDDPGTWQQPDDFQVAPSDYASDPQYRSGSQSGNTQQDESDTSQSSGPKLSDRPDPSKAVNMSGGGGINPGFQGGFAGVYGAGKGPGYVKSESNPDGYDPDATSIQGGGVAKPSVASVNWDPANGPMPFGFGGGGGLSDFGHPANYRIL